MKVECYNEGSSSLCTKDDINDWYKNIQKRYYEVIGVCDYKEIYEFFNPYLKNIVKSFIQKMKNDKLLKDALFKKKIDKLLDPDQAQDFIEMNRENKFVLNKNIKINLKEERVGNTFKNQHVWEMVKHRKYLNL